MCYRNIKVHRLRMKQKISREMYPYDALWYHQSVIMNDFLVQLLFDPSGVNQQKAFLGC